MSAALQRRTGLRGFDFATERDRAAMGHLLGRITRATLEPAGVMLSALVH